MRVAGAMGLAVGLLLVGGPAIAQDGPTEEERLAAECGGSADGVVLETVDYAAVDGEIVRACLAYPDTGTPTHLVTFAHGIGHDVQSSWSPHVLMVAQQGVVAIATNYRDNFGFPSLRGAEDMIVLTQAMQQRFPSVTTTTMFAVSMGGSVGGTAIAEAPRLNGGDGLWDHLVFVEGVSNVTETYLEAAAVAAVGNETGQRAQDGIERDTGGTPATVPQEYARRSPITRVTELAANGIQSAAVVHAPFDGLVGFHQGVSMAAALCTAGIPTSIDVPVTGSGERDDSTVADLISSDLEDANESTLDLTGHASEADAAHPVMAQAFSRLADLIAGTPFSGGCAEVLGATAPDPTTPAPDAPSTPAPAATDTPAPAPSSSPATTTQAAPMPVTGGGVGMLAIVAAAGLAVRRRRRSA